MKKNFADYETSMKLKQLGFNEDCFKIYCSSSNSGDNEIQLWKSETIFEKDLSKNNELTNENSCAAPLWQQVVEWLFDEKEIYISVSQRQENDYYFQVMQDSDVVIEQRNYETPMQAEREGTKKTILYLWKEEFGKNI